MQISKATLSFTIIIVALAAGMLGYMVNEIRISQERAELQAEITRLQEELEAKETELELADEDEPNDDTDETQSPASRPSFHN